MIHHGNDRWSGAFTPVEPGQYALCDRGLDRRIRHLVAMGLRASSAPAPTSALDAIEGAGLLTKAHGARQDAAAV